MVMSVRGGAMFKHWYYRLIMSSGSDSCRRALRMRWSTSSMHKSARMLADEDEMFEEVVGKDVLKQFKHSGVGHILWMFLISVRWFACVLELIERNVFCQSCGKSWKRRDVNVSTAYGSKARKEEHNDRTSRECRGSAKWKERVKNTCFSDELAVCLHTFVHCSTMDCHNCAISQTRTVLFSMLHVMCVHLIRVIMMLGGFHADAAVVGRVHEVACSGQLLRDTVFLAPCAAPRTWVRLYAKTWPMSVYSPGGPCACFVCHTVQNLDRSSSWCLLSFLPVMHRCVRIPSALGFGSRVSSRLLLSRSLSVTKELSGGWYQVLNKGEEYFWHKPSNKTTWTLPADIPLQTTSFADTASRNREHTHSGSHGERRADLESQTRADSELPEGWTAVHSAEHDREYYWHTTSKSTMWDKPALSPRHVSAELERVLKEHGYINLTLVIAGLLYRYKPGETLNTADFDLLHGVLGYHNDYPRKLGGGVRSIKVDVAPIVAPTSDKREGLSVGQSSSVSERTKRPVVERTGRLVVTSDQELNVGNAQIRTLLDRQKKSKSSPNVRAEIKKHEFQTDYDRRSVRKLGEIIESQQEELHCARAEELQQRDQQLLQGQLLQQNPELREAHNKKSQWTGRIEEVSEFHLRHYCKTKIGRGSGHYLGTYRQDTGIAEWD